MIDYESKAPGVYVEETPPVGIIAGAGTSTAAMIGQVAKLRDGAVVNEALSFTNWSQFVEGCGGLSTKLPLGYAVRGFFENGGRLVQVVPVAATAKDADVDKALTALSRIREVSLVCVPGAVDKSVQAAVLKHCEDMGNRFAVLDGVQTDDDPNKADGPLGKQRGDLDSKLGFGALYWPWIKVGNPAAKDDATKEIFVPPSGHVAGIMARSDGQYGVHKAPANEQVRGALSLGFLLNDTEQGALNKAGINALRSFPGRPPVVWGARTLTANPALRYVNVRRLVSFVEDSIQQGVAWAVFAPNNTTLWKQLERTITEFLTRVWQSGALFGRTAADAFYVRIDEELNPPDVRKSGRVFVEIGLAPVSPAEHIVLRFGLWDGPAGN